MQVNTVKWLHFLWEWQSIKFLYKNEAINQVYLTFLVNYDDKARGKQINEFLMLI